MTLKVITLQKNKTMDFLNNKEYLNNIDDDCSTHGETTVGINFKNELMVTYRYLNDECHRYNTKNHSRCR